MARQRKFRAVSAAGTRYYASVDARDDAAVRLAVKTGARVAVEFLVDGSWARVGVVEPVCSQCGPGHAGRDGLCERHGKIIPAVGYVCKTCGNASPIGVGYADSTPGAYARSAGLTQCACGNSRAAR